MPYVTLFQSKLKHFITLLLSHLKNVVPHNLFKHLKNYWPSNHQVDLDTYFKDWTEQVGYPMLTVSTNSNGGFSLRQKRFLLDPNDGSDPSLRYTIPITYNSNVKNNYKDFEPVFYFNKTLEKVQIGNEGMQENWILLNTQQSNYYRVFYDSDLMIEILKAFKEQNHSNIHETNRANVINDLFAFARAGLKSYDEIFEFLEYLSIETEYIPWQAAFKGFQVLSVHFTLQQHKEFGDFLKEILRNVYMKLGFQRSDDTVLDVYNRNKVIGWLCKYHHEDCNSQAKLIFRSHMSNHTKVNTDFRETLYCAACRNDDSDIYDSLKEIFIREDVPSEREKILRAMGCTRFNVVTHYEFILSNNVAPDLKDIGLKGLYSRTPENIMTVFKLMITNVEELKQCLQDWTLTASVICDVTGYLSTEEQLNMLTQFVNENGHRFGTSVSILENSLRTLNAKLKWADTHLLKLSNYLSVRNNSKSISGSLLTISILYLLI